MTLVYHSILHTTNHRNIRTIKTLNPTIRSPETHLSAKILFPHLGVDPRDLLAPALSIATSPLAIIGRNQKAPIFGTGTTGDKRKISNVRFDSGISTNPGLCFRAARAVSWTGNWRDRSSIIGEYNKNDKNDKGVH